MRKTEFLVMSGLNVCSAILSLPLPSGRKMRDIQVA